MSGLVQVMWERFEALVLTGEYSQIQRREMRRAFFAGVYGMLDLSRDAAQLPELEAVARLESIEAECVDFCQEITRGKA